MANLRANNLCGTGGRNAINGSVYFSSENGYLSTTIGAIGTSNFTIEWWFRPTKNAQPGTANRRIFRLGANNATGSMSINFDAVNNDMQWNYNDATLIGASTHGVYAGSSGSGGGSWYHIAAVREGTGSNQTKIYVNGLLSDQATNSTDFTQTAVQIGWDSTLSDDFGFYGYISNLRVTKSAVYTAAFIPPTEKLTVLTDTILLCCQDSDDPKQEATGKTITSYGTAMGGLASGQFHAEQLPLIGVDEGVTFSGDTKINSLGHMYFPTGDTSQRSRGRGLVAGGSVPGNSTAIDYTEIQTGGQSQDFGDLTVTGQHTACASAIRGVFAMGSNNNTIDFVNIVTTANAVNFGDRTVALNGPGALSNNTRGVFLGGGSPSPQSDVMDYITIASVGNAIDFGNMSTGNKNSCGLASPTRGIIAHGGDPFTTVIDYITIASAGNAADFGDTVSAGEGYSGAASSTRGIFAGGYVSPGETNIIQYITIASTGNATDFGDLTRVNQSGAGTSNSLRAIFAGGGVPSSTNTIDYVDIATTGNAKEFGDMVAARSYIGSCSDSHGGIE